MSNLEVASKIRILDFDIENRPLSYWVPDRPTAEITAIAWSWVGQESVSVSMLGQDKPEHMLADFVDAYNQADMVTGHYIRRHDLPHINSALMEMGMPPLSPKLTCDTKLDMVRKGDLPATQEHLADMLGVEEPKTHMTQAMWREANRLTKEGLAFTKIRVTSDVRQHKALRLAMLKAGLLGGPKVWRS